MFCSGNYTGVDSAADIEKWFIDHTKEIEEKTSFGIVFNMKKNADNFPSDFVYTIRGPMSLLPDTGQLFPPFQMPGPSEAGGTDFRYQYLGLST